MRIVVALGESALLERGQRPDASTQEANIRRAVSSIAALADDHELVVTHGNEPQVGVLALESESDGTLSRPYPLDVLGAETEGMVGYWLQRELANALPGRRVVTLLTQTVVAGDDPAFADPQTLIGRRVVPSPRPVAIVELVSIRALLGIGTIVVCAGGGGVPVVRSDRGLRGVDAVVDKDRAAALLAHQLDADALLMLTDTPSLRRAFDTADAPDVDVVTVGELRALSFPRGSMGPKVEAGCEFVEGRDRRLAAIGSLGDADAMLRGVAGIRIVRDRDAPYLTATGVTGAPVAPTIGSGVAVSRKA